jgi:vacuolar-type H+-ATPase subunit F/Vma7
VAQTDVIYTFTRGIDPAFEREWKEKLNAFAKEILNLTENEKSNEIINLKEKIIEEMDDYLEENYRNPIFKIVGSLPKINLTEMAEALINITSLRRHMSTDSESVGGPTDVALISKVDGFIWVKRKDYFGKQKDGA